MAWTEEKKAEVVEMYKAGNPTAENSAELVKEIAEQLEESPNGVRMVLTNAKVYVKKDAAAESKTTKTGEATKRVSKESQIAALRKAIEDRGAPVDTDILDKLTGKAAVYFVTVLETK